MPAKTETAQQWTTETSETTPIGSPSLDRTTPPEEPSCGCECCQEVDRDEMWIRWA
jgi:hypothetical protein